jgi:hypothetical protein
MSSQHFLCRMGIRHFEAMYSVSFT